MKKDLIKISILFLILITISTSVILLFGRTYTFSYDIDSNDNYQLEIDNPGIVEIVKQKRIDNKNVVTVKAKKPGNVFLYYSKGVFQVGTSLYVHKSMIITDNNYFGKSTGSEIIPISLSIFLAYILYILFKRYLKSKKENLYQYKNIAYLGIIIFLAFELLGNVTSIFNYRGLYETINNTISLMSNISFFLFPIALLTFTLVTISNIVLIIKEGISLKNLLGLFFGIFICVLTLVPDYVYKLLMQSQKVNIYNLNSAGPYIYNFVESLVYLSIAYLECVLISTIIIAIKSNKKKIDYNEDYIIILGCKIRKDGTLPPLLKGRVDKALQIRDKQLKNNGKDLIFVTSGGQGSDEIISEAEAMKKYLQQNGIDEKNIIVEDKSKNTYENIKNSYKLINSKKAHIAFSTTNYHVLRTGLIATEQGLVLDGIGSNTKAYFWINAFIREFIGTLYSERKKHITVLIIIMIILILMITVTYYANNI